MAETLAVASCARASKLHDGTLTPREHVERIASRKIQGFVGTIDQSGEYFDPVHKQNQSLSEHVIADYHGRFLIELIQNGHDAHDKATADGEIVVLLAADEEAHGVLYVANRGQPFQGRNVDALCEMGLSSKPPGEAVGNKGLGFRSVRHVTDTPQIYSRLTEQREGGALDGYRFTFLRDEGLDPLLGTDRLREMAKADLPAFYIPGWIEDTPGVVTDFADRGFSSIIRLPIRSASALRDVADEIGRLVAAEAPILLFLRRIKTLQVQLTGNRLADDVVDLALRRDETPLGGDTGLSLVDLGDNGRFWVARAEVPEAEMQAAVADGLASGALPQSWKGWKGAGEVALAAPAGEEEPAFKPRLYTFLPMGQGASSPFRGHLHGSFFPSSNRKTLDPTVEVNALVLRKAVALAADAAFRLTGAASQGALPNVPSALAVRVAVDFILWETPSSLAPPEQTGKASKIELGADIADAIAGRWGVDSAGEAAFVPCLGVWSGDPLSRPEFGPVDWRVPAAARSATTLTSCFNLDIVARFGEQAGVALYWSGLGRKRTDALAQFLNDYGDHWDDALSPHERAEIVEGLAKHLAKAKKQDLKRWREFYRDTPTFMSNLDGPLAGRAIFYCQDGSLRAARAAAPVPADGDVGKRRRRQAQDAVVFVPPARGDAEDAIGEAFYPPVALREFFAFLHDELPWYGDLAAARQYLERSLAQPFESEALLNRISQIVERDETKKVRFAGLRWAFAIWRRSLAIKRPIALGQTYRLYVPNLDGDLIRATDAVFSAAWPAHTLGGRLQHFLEMAPSSSQDLAEVRRRRLALPVHPVFGVGTVELWAEFLRGLGLQRGLQPRSVALDGYVHADRLTSLSVLADLGLPSGVAAQIQVDVAARAKTLTLPSSTRYQIAEPIWWLPGQADLADFTDEALDAYAVLITEWVTKLEPRQLKMTVRHQYNYRSDVHEWPSPLAAFLRSVAWAPCEEQGPEGSRRRRCKGSQVWLASGLDRYPPFLRRPSYKFGRALDRAPDGAISALRQHAGFKTFNAAETLLEQAEFLADQVAEGCVRRFHERELVNIYNRVWIGLASQYGTPQSPDPSRWPPGRLLVRQRGQLALVPATGAQAETIYVRDNADSIAVGLIDVVGHPLLDVRTPDPARIGVTAKRLYSDRVRLTSTVAYGVKVGGTPLDDVPLGPRLVDGCPWLRAMLAVALEALDSVDLNRLPADRSGIVQSLDRIELQLSAQIAFDLEGQDVTPEPLRPAYAFQRSAAHPLLIIIGGGELTWSRLEAALPAIGELVHHAAVVPHLKLLMRQAAIDGIPIDDRPHGPADLLRLCQALNLNDQSVDAARAALGERIDRQLPWLRAAVHQLGGEPALEIWSSGEAEAIEDRASLVDLLTRCLLGAGASPEELVDAVTASLSVGELRERLGFEFAAFNVSLAASGSPPDVDIEGQASQLAFYIQDHQREIGDALRSLVAPRVLAFEPDRRYGEAREALTRLEPDPAWAPLFQRVPDEHLKAHVAAWLAVLGAPAIGANPLELDDVATVRAANAGQLRTTAKTAQPLVRAWGVLRSMPTHEVWRDPTLCEGELRRRLDEAAAMDCRAWSEAGFLTWFQRLGVWPAEMPLTLDRELLGVAETEVEAEAQKAREDRAQRDREARSVKLNGVLRDPQALDWFAISEEIAAGLRKSVLNRPIGVFTPLAPANAPSSRQPRSGTSTPGGAYRGVPQIKKDMIGRLGELAVYHWLKARQPGQDIDECWVSGNRQLVAGREGNDSAGYDFRIAFNKQTWFIEVKASTEDPCQFEMGETEVRKAREVARSRRAERYVIAYVANVGNSSQTAIELLPNPFSAEADGALWIAGDSIRYGFKRGRA